MIGERDERMDGRTDPPREQKDGESSTEGEKENGSRDRNRQIV